MHKGVNFGQKDRNFENILRPQSEKRIRINSNELWSSIARCRKMSKIKNRKSIWFAAIRLALLGGFYFRIIRKKIANLCKISFFQKKEASQ